MSPLPLVVSGVAGRMGRQILAAALADPAISIAGGLARAGSPAVGQDLGTLAGAGPIGVTASDEREAAAVLSGARVLVDFSHADATASYARVAAEHGCAFLTGTTGLGEDQLAAVTAEAARVPVLVAPNTSVGVTALLQLLPALARALGADYDLEIVETHHRHKADAPSGTALAIAGVLAGAKEHVLANHAVFGREGRAPRQPNEIGIHAVRAGGIPGEHRIILASEGETIEVLHRATSRQTYAAGALRAARWLAGRPAGLYAIGDVLREA